MNTLLLTITAVVAYTGVSLLFKAAASRTRSEHLTLMMLVTVAVLALGYGLLRGNWIGTLEGALVALFSGVLFYFATVFRQRALQTSPVSLVFAITNLDLVISGVILLFIPFFETDPTIGRLLAVAFAAAAVLLGARLKDANELSLFTYASLVLLTISNLGYIYYTQNLTPIIWFIIVDHLAGVVLNVRRFPSVQRSEVVWGLGTGAVLFVGFFAVLQAISVGGETVPLVLLALSLRTPLTALLSVPIFNERFTWTKGFAVLLASVALIFWELPI